jgi:pimeloyl-ACP methyl ester carboxylesterase
MSMMRVRDADLDGEFACPDGEGPFRAVLALGGSEGGIPEYFLRLLVAHGFACLALAYFNTPDTQAALMEVPLERIERGLRWLRDEPNVVTPDGRAAVVGGSKGGELALLVAATFPELVGPVVAYTPSHVVWAGIDFRNPRAPLRSSWSKGGQPLPFVPYPHGVGGSMTERGMSVLPIYDHGLDDGAAVDAAAIPIERATGPVLLISGGDDRMWPAARMCEMAVERMRGAGRGASIRHLRFRDAGHVLFPFEAPSNPMAFDLGGAPGAGARAHAEAWPETVHVLEHGTFASK